MKEKDKRGLDTKICVACGSWCSENGERNERREEEEEDEDERNLS